MFLHSLCTCFFFVVWIIAADPIDVIHCEPLPPQFHSPHPPPSPLPDINSAGPLDAPLAMPSLALPWPLAASCLVVLTIFGGLRLLRALDRRAAHKLAQEEDATGRPLKSGQEPSGVVRSRPRGKMAGRPKGKQKAWERVSASDETGNATECAAVQPVDPDPELACSTNGIKAALAAAEAANVVARAIESRTGSAAI